MKKMIFSELKNSVISKSFLVFIFINILLIFLPQLLIQRISGQPIHLFLSNTEGMLNFVFITVGVIINLIFIIFVVFSRQRALKNIDVVSSYISSGIERKSFLTISKINELIVIFIYSFVQFTFSIMLFIISPNLYPAEWIYGTFFSSLFFSVILWNMFTFVGKVIGYGKIVAVITMLSFGAVFPILSQIRIGNSSMQSEALYHKDHQPNFLINDALAIDLDEGVSTSKSRDFYFYDDLDESFTTEKVQDSILSYFDVGFQMEQIKKMGTPKLRLRERESSFYTDTFSWHKEWSIQSKEGDKWYSLWISPEIEKLIPKQNEIVEIQKNADLFNEIRDVVWKSSPKVYWEGDENGSLLAPKDINWFTELKHQIINGILLDGDNELQNDFVQNRNDWKVKLLVPAKGYDNTDYVIENYKTIIQSTNGKKLELDSKLKKMATYFYNVDTGADARDDDVLNRSEESKKLHLDYLLMLQRAQKKYIKNFDSIDLMHDNEDFKLFYQSVTGESVDFNFTEHSLNAYTVSYSDKIAPITIFLFWLFMLIPLTGSTIFFYGRGDLIQ